MIIKKIIDKFRNKGYDDFYMADFARKHENVLMLELCSLQCGVLALLALMSTALKMSVTLTVFLAFWACATGTTFFFCWTPSLLIQGSKSEIEKGQEMDLRGRYVIASVESKFILKAVRYAPAISYIFDEIGVSPILNKLRLNQEDLVFFVL